MAAKSPAARSKASLDEDSAKVLNAFRTLVKGLRAADRNTVQEHGVGSAQIFVLHSLEADEPLSVNQLAERLATDQSTVSIIVTKLVDRDLVERTRSALDARRVELTLTRKGKALARKVPLAFQESFLSALESLSTARREALAVALTEVIERMGIAEEHPPLLLADSTRRKKR